MMSFFLNNGPRTHVCNMVEMVVGTVVESGCAPKVSRAKIRSLLHINSGADAFVSLLVFRSGFMVLTVRTVRKLVDRVVDEKCSSSMKRASFATADTNLLI